MQRAGPFILATATVILGLIPPITYADSPDKAGSTKNSMKNEGSSEKPEKSRDSTKERMPEREAAGKQGAGKQEKKVEEMDKAIVNPCYGNQPPSWCQ